MHLGGYDVSGVNVVPIIFCSKRYIHKSSAWTKEEVRSFPKLLSDKKKAKKLWSDWKCWQKIRKNRDYILCLKILLGDPSRPTFLIELFLNLG